MSGKAIDEEIASINRSIDAAEDTDPLYMHPELKKLRNRVMYVHARLEASIGLILWSWIRKSAEDTVDRQILQQMGSRFDIVVSDMDFTRKVSMAKKFSLIQGTMVNRMYEVNNWRVKFSHPKAYETELMLLQEREGQLKVLRALQASLDEIDAFFAAKIAASRKTS